MNTSIFYRNILFCMLVLLCSNLIGQNNWERCGQVQADSLIQLAHPEHFFQEEFEQWLEDNLRDDLTATPHSLLTIPVIVHVVHDGEIIGRGANISYEQVLSQIEVLNEDFQRIEGSRGFNNHPDGANIGIEFCPVAVDESGNLLEEPGVHRYEGNLNSWTMDRIESTLKINTIWDPTQYFNIWTVNMGNSGGEDLIGYAQFPSRSEISGLNVDEGLSQTDGVVVDYRAFGSSEKGNFPTLEAPLDLGRVTTHETGHWLGLRHIWGDGRCNADDYCEDTPTAREANYGCRANNSCGSLDMIENYMDYTDDECMNIFTLDQKERMLTVLENSPRRKELLESTACQIPSELVAEGAEIEVFPNPTTELLNIRITAEAIENIDDYTLHLFDIGGKLWVTDLARTNTTTSLSINDLPTGIYLLKVVNDAFSKTYKIIKL